ncbi:hypothetical protein ACJW31_12G176800 [Castanea mollissima]
MVLPSVVLEFLLLGYLQVSQMMILQDTVTKQQIGIGVEMYREMQEVQPEFYKAFVFWFYSDSVDQIMSNT